MMVSKIAVVALVAIVSCPILLGYAMNLTEVTESEYKITGDSVNVTNLLKTGTSYNYAHGDIYKMNTVFQAYDNILELPTYNKVSSVSSSFPLTKAIYYNGSWNGGIQGVNYPYFYEQFDYNPLVTNLRVVIYGMVGGVEQQIGSPVDYFHSFYYDRSNHNSYYTWYDGSQQYIKSGVHINVEMTKIVLYSVVGIVDLITVEYCANNKFVDFASGWYFPYTPVNVGGANNIWPTIALPDNSKEFTFTVDLDSITASSYTIHINYAPRVAVVSYQPMRTMELKKTTVDGNVSWTLKNECDTSEAVTNLYYNPSGGNTYQFTISADQEYDETTGKYTPVTNIKASYVGVWPTKVGLANSYIDYDLNYYIRDDPNMIFNDPLTLDDLSYWRIYYKVDNNARTPTMRIDDAYYRAFEYQVIENKTYSPSTFKENPSTKLTDIKMYGTSISFGGVSYAVNDGNITLGTHQIPVKDLELSSSLVNGVYENKIGNTIISTTADPSDITFNGQWSVNITTSSMEQSTYTKTSWTPGHFGWDGLDQNFLMIGLLSSVGVFIALGLYVRRTRSSLWPLLIVCGGAVMLFFIML